MTERLRARWVRGMLIATALVLVGVAVAAAAPATPAKDSAAGPNKAAPPGAETEKRPPIPRAPRRQAPPAAVVLPDVDPAYRCRPDEDIACTVVRETPQGVLIVSFRPAGRATERKTWAVVSGAPAGAAATNGGTVYVVPHLPQNLTPSTAPGGTVASSLPNGAPILE